MRLHGQGGGRGGGVEGGGTSFQLRLIHDVHQHRQYESRCLSGARLGNSLRTSGWAGGEAAKARLQHRESANTGNARRRAGIGWGVRTAEARLPQAPSRSSRSKQGVAQACCCLCDGSSESSEMVGWGGGGHQYVPPAQSCGEALGLDGCRGLVPRPSHSRHHRAVEATLRKGLHRPRRIEP